MKINKKVILPIAMLAVAIMGFVGCSPKSAEKKGDNATTASSEITLTHKLGETKVKQNPTKVVVFDYGTIDSLDKMGVEITALPKSNVPSYLNKYKDEKYIDAGGLKEPDFEKIQSLKPELIIISARQADSYEKLSKIAPTLYVEILTNDFLNSVKKNITTLGQIFDKEDLVKEEIAKIDTATKTLNENITKSGQNALIVMANDGNLSAFGTKSRFGILHSAFGFPQADKAIEESTHGMSVSFEYIAETNPDYLFIIDRSVATGSGQGAAKTLDNDIIKGTSAYKNKKIVTLNTETWYLSSGGITGTNMMIEEVSKTLENK